MKGFWLDNPQEAFERAIRRGNLSDNPQSGMFAGHYSYMGSEQIGPTRKDYFKRADRIDDGERPFSLTTP